MQESCVVEYVKNGYAYISLITKKDCGGCKACMLGRGKVIAPAIMDVSCVSGDSVLVNMPQKEILSAPFILYLIPLLFLFAGYFVGRAIGGELYEFLCAISFCIVSFIIVFMLDRLYKRQKKFMPVIVQVISQGD